MFRAKTAFLFPGHGVQHSGMGRWLYEHCEEFRDLLTEIQHALPFSYSLENLLTGENPLLNSDECAAQVAVYVVNAGYDLFLKKNGIAPAITYGYSSGIYSSVCSSGSISVIQGVRLVLGAFDCMQSVIPANSAGMIAITGLTLAAVQEIVSESGDLGPITVANINSDRQFFLSGKKEALDNAFSSAHRPGLLNIRWLPVSIPYHSPLLAPAVGKFRQLVASIELKKPDIPLLSGDDGSVVQDCDPIRELLINQLVNPVDFPNCLETLLNLRINDFWEVGPGDFLYKLLRRQQRVKRIFQARTWTENH